MDMSLNKLWEIVKDRKVWGGTVHGVLKSWTQPSNWTTTKSDYQHHSPIQTGSSLGSTSRLWGWIRQWLPVHHHSTSPRARHNWYAGYYAEKNSERFWYQFQPNFSPPPSCISHKNIIFTALYTGKSPFSRKSGPQGPPVIRECLDRVVQEQFHGD